MPAPAPLIGNAPNAGFVSSMPVNTLPPSGGKSKTKLIAAVAVVAVLIVGVALAVTLVGGKGGSPKYKDSDLTTVSTNAYSVSIPKQWTDSSSDQSLLKKYQISADSFQNIKMYTYGYNQKTGSIQSVYIVADQVTDVTDEQMRTVLQDPQRRALFESTYSAIMDSVGKSAECASSENKTTTYKYDTNGYVVLVDAELDCILTPAVAKIAGDPSAHYVMKIGIANSKTYIVLLASVKSDWQKNSDFYKQKVMNGFKPQ